MRRGLCPQFASSPVSGRSREVTPAHDRERLRLSPAPRGSLSCQGLRVADHRGDQGHRDADAPPPGPPEQASSPPCARRSPCSSLLLCEVSWPPRPVRPSQAACASVRDTRRVRDSPRLHSTDAAPRRTCALQLAGASEPADQEQGAVSSRQLLCYPSIQGVPQDWLSKTEPDTVSAV